MEQNAYVMEAISGVVYLVPIAIMWLVFFPPAAYRRWIEGAASA